MEDIWKPIPNYEEAYEASDLGYVRRVLPHNRYRILKKQKTHDGSKEYICLVKNGKRKNLQLDFIIAKTFIDKDISFGTTISHIDENKYNCSLNNLFIIDNKNTDLICRNKEWMSPQDLPGEIWMPIKEYDGLFASNFGRIKKMVGGNPCIQKQQLTYNGYLVVKIKQNGVNHSLRVHRAVAMAFVPNLNNLPQVNHKDEDKLNNCAYNLEWCTSEYNNNYGTKRYRISNSIKNKKDERDRLGAAQV